jgi:hypothetical protein
MAPEVRLGEEGSGGPSVLWRGVVGKHGSDALNGAWGGIRIVPRVLKSATMKTGFTSSGAAGALARAAETGRLGLHLSRTNLAALTSRI